MTGITSLELELTGRCQLACAHCYADSGPAQGHGAMTAADWCTVMDQAAECGVELVQFIGGEPTLRPGFPELLRHALDVGHQVEVFSNLVHVTAELWDLFERPGVSLATSYYGMADHDTVTGRRGSLGRTRANIAQALRRSIPLRAGIVGVVGGQNLDTARAELEALGVKRIRIDHSRGVGRAAMQGSAPTTAELCGRCGRGKAAISPDGDVWPCVIGRFLTAGNVRAVPLAKIFAGQAWARIVEQIPDTTAVCNPDCNPARSDGADCAPAETETCAPSFCDPDTGDD